MDYAKHYDLLIQKRKLHVPAGYSENHHIVPVSWGGGDEPENLVRLTAREHRLAHLLLFRMSKGKRRAAMAASIFLLGKTSSRAYELARKEQAQRMSEATSERMRHDNPFKGKPSNIAGRRWITDGKSNRCVSPDANLPDGWKYGRTIVFTEEGLKRKSQAVAAYNRSRINPLKDKTWKMSDDGRKKCQAAAILRDKRLKEQGRNTLAALSAANKWVKGRVWIRKDNSTKMIDQKDLSDYLSEGWFLGRGKLSRG